MKIFWFKLNHMCYSTSVSPQLLLINNTILVVGTRLPTYTIVVRPEMNVISAAQPTLHRISAHLYAYRVNIRLYYKHCPSFKVSIGLEDIRFYCY